LCEGRCAKIAAAGCASDPPRETCVEECSSYLPAGCIDEVELVLACQVAQPQNHYACTLGRHAVTGCEQEAYTFDMCRLGPPN
jgi:hypothetical protein